MMLLSSDPLTSEESLLKIIASSSSDSPAQLESELQVGRLEWREREARAMALVILLLLLSCTYVQQGRIIGQRPLLPSSQALVAACSSSNRPSPPARRTDLNPGLFFLE